MAKRTPNGDDEAPPKRYPQTPPPQDLHPTSDIRFVMTEIGKFGAQIEHLVKEVGEQKKSTTDLTRTVDRFRTGTIVAATILGVVVTIVWWVIGGQITAIRDAIISQQYNALAHVPDNAADERAPKK